MRLISLAAVLAAALVLSPGLVRADDRAGPPGPARPEGSARAPDARLEALLQALARALRTLPGYGAPEVNAQGDIVIRRRAAPASLPDAARI
jgi:hypothetical protein